MQSRLANDVGGVQSTITTTAASVVSNVVVVGSTLVAMLLLSVPLTLLSLVLVPLFVVLSNRVGRRRRAARRETQASLAEMSAITQETLSVSGILLAKIVRRPGARGRPLSGPRTSGRSSSRCARRWSGARSSR